MANTITQAAFTADSFPLAQIPLSAAPVPARGVDNILQAIRSQQLSGPGPFSAACESLIRATVGAEQAYLVPSCSAALEMAALLLGLGPGDEVIMPSFTFVSTANAVVLRGATPVFIDVDPVTLNLDPALIEAAITPRTKSISVVHYAGVVADMAKIGSIADRLGLSVVEDAAQAYGSSRGGRLAGSFAPLSCFSFHGTKNIAAGEAGALVVNDPQHARRAAITREKGTDREQFIKGQVSAYRWQDVGSSFVVSELVAALLAAQLEDLADITARRLAMWNRYHEAFADIAEAGTLGIPHPPPDCRHNGHVFFLMLPDARARSSLRQFLAEQSITSASHFEPLHLSPAGLRFGRTGSAMPVTVRAGECLLRLPLYDGLQPLQERVIDAVRAWCRKTL